MIGANKAIFSYSTSPAMSTDLFKTCSQAEFIKEQRKNQQPATSEMRVKALEMANVFNVHHSSFNANRSLVSKFMNHETVNILLPQLRALNKMSSVRIQNGN